MVYRLWFCFVFLGEITISFMWNMLNIEFCYSLTTKNKNHQPQQKLMSIRFWLIRSTGVNKKLMGTDIYLIDWIDHQPSSKGYRILEQMKVYNQYKMIMGKYPKILDVEAFKDWILLDQYVNQRANLFAYAMFLQLGVPYLWAPTTIPLSPSSSKGPNRWEPYFLSTMQKHEGIKSKEQFWFLTRS